MQLSKTILQSDEYFKGDRIEIFPTDTILYYLIKFDHLSREVYNWGLQTENDLYDQYKADHNKPRFYSFIQLSMQYEKELNTNPSMSYLKELPLNSARESLKEVINAFQMFFDGYTRYPKKRVKDRNLLSFRTRAERASIGEDGVRIEGLPRGMKIHTNDRRYVNYGSRSTDIAKLFNTGIRFDGDRFWFTFQVIRKKEPINAEITGPIGIDIGQKTPAMVSDGRSYKKPNTKKLEKRIKHEQRHVARDRKRIDELIKESGGTATKEELMSNNMKKRAAKLRKLQQKKTNIMDNFYYTSANDMIKNNPSAVCLETIRVRDITDKYPSSNKFMHEISMRKYSEIIQHVSKKHSIPVILADKEFPSSQLCSNCGYQNKNIGGHRVFICPKCGTRIDRDLNAAINLEKLYYGNSTNDNKE